VLLHFTAISVVELVQSKQMKVLTTCVVGAGSGKTQDGQFVLRQETSGSI